MCGTRLVVFTWSLRVFGLTSANYHFVPVTPELICCACMWLPQSTLMSHLTDQISKGSLFNMMHKMAKTNKITLHNSLLLFPPHCIPSVNAMFATQHEQERDKRNMLPIDDGSPDCFWYSNSFYFRLKLLPCGQKIGGERFSY